MLLFIMPQLRGNCKTWKFQYISCCCLSRARAVSKEKNSDFNTSHVVVYQRPLTEKEKLLSNFNTSHVVVYHCIEALCLMNDKFQYISCCCLSEWRDLSVTYIYGFQYISCCCLSRTRSPEKSRQSISIHLMLLFIPLFTNVQQPTSLISIHLMLLFIR